MLYVNKVIIISVLLGTPLTTLATCVGLNCNCTISAGAFNIGSYAPLSGNSTTGTSTVSVTCTALVAGLLVAYDISLSTGSSGTYTTRTMNSASYTLNYNLYTDPSHTIVFGNGSGGTAMISDTYNLLVTNMTRNYNFYGLIPASQNVGAGSYSDSITATVTF